MAKLLSFREEGWDFGGHGQREWQGRDWNTGSRPAGVGSRGLAMDRLEDRGSIRELRARRKNWLWLETRKLLSSLQVAVWAAPSRCPQREV